MCGWYTDRYGRHRPITRRKPKREKIGSPVLRVVPPKNDFMFGYSIIRRALSFVLSQVPIIRELWLIYAVADSIYQKWSLVKEFFTRLKKNDLIGAGKVVGQEIVSEKIQDVQLQAVSNLISKCIPPQYHMDAQNVVDSLFNEITDEEIKFVKESLSKI